MRAAERSTLDAAAHRSRCARHARVERALTHADALTADAEAAAALRAESDGAGGASAPVAIVDPAAAARASAAVR